MTLNEAEEYARKHWKAVTLCCECKWYYRGGATCMFWDGENSMCGDDYCSRAERKEHEIVQCS